MPLKEKVALQKCQNLADDIADNVALEPFIYEAFASTKRELFVPDGLGHLAYRLDALPLSSNQWISSPLTVAKMTVALELHNIDNILEIGCGSGYQAAILSKMVRRVFTIERINKLLQEAKKRFETLGLHNIHTRFDDGQRGWRTYAPFERILFSASTEAIPKAIFSQLKDGGILVAPIEKDGHQIITQFIKNGSSIIKKELEECLFVPVKDGVSK